MTEQKKLKIKQSLAQTKSKRSSQQCHVYKVKIQYNKLNRLQQQQLKMLFVEGKWFYNYLLNQQNIFNINTTNIKNIIHYDKNKQQINSQIKFIGSSIKQSILQNIKSSIKSLSTHKKNGHNIGFLKHISQLKSINLKQYKVAYNIKNNKIKIQGIKGYLKVNGLQQLKDNQIANAKLLNRSTGYYIAITTFKQKQQKVVNTNKSIGIDFGCTNSFTLSNGQIYSYSIKETGRLKRLQKILISKQKHSNNRNKIILKIRRQYEHINNQKNDITNKFIHYLTSNYSTIAIQDQQLKQWSANGHGSAIQHSILGRVKSKLIANKVNVINKWQPTTKTCSNCGYVREINLFERTYQCPKCGLIIDRDINSAMNILNSSPMEHRLNALITNRNISQIRSSQSLD